MNNFCTLFDKNYIHIGLALYNSCLKHCGDFKMWILCLDEETADILKKLELKKAALIPLSDLKDNDLLKVKNEREAGEFAWTSKPSFLKYVMDKINFGEAVVYLDADTLIFSSPEKILNEFKKYSIMLTPHNFSSKKAKEKEAATGKFNAGTIFMRKNETSLKCLDKWRKQCLDWCYKTYNNGRLGDQMYLNEWPSIYKGVHVLKNKGVNAGSWNIKNYKVVTLNEKIFIDQDPLVWYHFHGFKAYLDKRGRLLGYPVNMINNTIYKKYVKNLRESLNIIRQKIPNFDFKIDKNPKITKLAKQFLFRTLERVGLAGGY